jgi:hypothetical protein
MENEIWKTIEDYPNYQVSNLGRVKSLSRTVFLKGKHPFISKEKILKTSIDNSNYYNVNLYEKGKIKTRTVHQLVAIAFLNHKPCGFKLVVNHKDFNKLNNCVENLEIVTQRENSNKKHLKRSSQYTGVYWYKERKKWRSMICINNKNKHLGYFETELEAQQAYQNKLKLI